MAGLNAPGPVPTAGLGFEKVDQYLETSIQDGHFPGAVLLVAQRGNVQHHARYGLAMAQPQTRPMTLATLFDLASLTKVIVTTTLVMKLVDEHAWQLDDLLADHLRPLKPLGPQRVTIRHALTHTSGLIPWANLFYRGVGRSVVRELLFENKWPILNSVCPPGERAIYSDLNFILLGLAIEAVTGRPLDAVAQRWIFDPCGMRHTCFNPDPHRFPDVAATENDVDRGGVLVGTVHDENAWAMEGVSGHAGVFSTAWDVALFAQMLLDRGVGVRGQVLSQTSVCELMRPQTEGLNERRTLGWMLYTSQRSSRCYFSTNTLFHTGFTGTSLLIDPERKLSVVLLTNRVHPLRRRDAEAMVTIRLSLHDLVVAVLS